MSDPVHVAPEHENGHEASCRACMARCFCRQGFECVRCWVARMRRAL